MSSPRVRRMLTLPLAVACALSAAAAGEVAGQGLPAVPEVPPIELPSVPETPPLEPPSQLPSVPEAPAVPEAPTVSVPRPSVPTPSVSDAPAASPSTPGSSAVQPTGAQPTTGPSSAARASSRPADTQAQARQSAARRRAVDTPRERRFRRSVRNLWACSYAVSDFERDVLVRRAGLEGFSATPTAAVASGLGVSARRVRSAQSSGLRELRGANRADGCAMDSAAGGLGSSAQTLLAVATAPPLATDAGDAVAQGPSSTNDRIEVLGAQRESTGVKVAAAPRATVTLAATGDGGTPPWPLLLILALLAAAAATPLLTRRRHRGVPKVHALEGYAPPEPAPPPVTEIPAAPSAEPESAPPGEPASPPRQRGVRASGLAVTGITSLVVTLLMRARRRR